MSVLIGMMNSMLNWSVERKMTIILFFGIVAFPLASLIILQSRGEAVTTNFLVGLLSVSIVLLVPFAKWMSKVVALRSIRELNTQCQLLKNGDYANVDLPSVKGKGHDFTTLKRNMHWMGYTIATRERRLQDAMSDLTAAQRQIGESLDYASLIQKSFLPNRAELAEVLPAHFLVWKQRDVVGGDSYWFKPWGDGFFLAVIDCTGHGVPGAFMTLIVHSLLDKAVTGSCGSPAEILGNMNRLIKDALNQNEKGAMSDDGMDCTLCFIQPEQNRLVFAGANNPLFVVDDGKARCIKGDRCGIGYIRSPRDFAFTDVEVSIKAGRRFYMGTDGLIDQVGGPRRFPFGKRRLMRFMEDASDRSWEAQGEELMRLLVDYQGDEPRRDDVTFPGFEVK